MSDLRKQLLRIAHARPDTRQHILPLIKKLATSRHVASKWWLGRSRMSPEERAEASRQAVVYLKKLNPKRDWEFDEGDWEATLIPKERHMKNLHVILGGHYDLFLEIVIPFVKMNAKKFDWQELGEGDALARLQRDVSEYGSWVQKEYDLGHDLGAGKADQRDEEQRWYDAD